MKHGKKLRNIPATKHREITHVATPALAYHRRGGSKGLSVVSTPPTIQTYTGSSSIDWGIRTPDTAPSMHAPEVRRGKRG